jgi:WXG100 family type VII secretion target
VSRVVVDLDRLADVVDRMDLFQAQLSRVGDHSRVRMAQVQASWTGAAANAHAAAHARWHAGASEVQEALAVLRSIVSTAHANYDAAMLANRRMWAP